MAVSNILNAIAQITVSLTTKSRWKKSDTGNGIMK